MKQAIFLTVFATIFMSAPVLLAQEGAENPFRSTAYPLPRFVSLASDKIYVRTGPGKQYPILWVYRRSQLPVEITLEFDHWRKIKDYDGQIGWVHKSLLSGKRTAIVQAEDLVTLHRKAKQDSRQLAYLQPGVIADIDECNAAWCKINASGYKGWVKQQNLWGVYPDEIVEN